MNIGDPDGYGLYGVLDEDANGLLCHDCGHRFTHLGLHAWRAHDTPANTYREAHGLPRRRGLVTEGTRQTQARNGRDNLPTNDAFIANRDPAKATMARLAAGARMSPAGFAASRAKPGRGRRGTVVTCGWCGVDFCPLTGAARRQFCTRSCASKASRPRDAPARRS